MTPNQYRGAIKSLGLSQRKAALFLDISERQSRRFALGEADIPRTVDLLLTLMVQKKIKPLSLSKFFSDLLSVKNQETKKSAFLT